MPVVKARCSACKAELDADLPFCVYCGATVAGAAADLLLDERFTIRELLRTGGMGAVYRAHDRASDSEVALKVMLEERATDPISLARFAREVDALRSVHHRNLMPVLHAGKLPDARPYYVMPLLNGDTLSEIVERGGALPPERAVQLVAGALDALEALHRAGFVHRDIKAENIIVNGDGEAVLLDLGIARPIVAPTLGAAVDAVVDAADDAGALTAHDVVLGTLEALAPEQITGAPVDARTDVYQVGALLLYLLCGRLAFDAESTQSWYDAHLHATPNPRASSCAGGTGQVAASQSVSPRLLSCCLKAMAKEPAERYGGAAEMARALRSAMGEKGGFWRRLFGR